MIADKLERNEIRDYPVAALREVLMNAVCHRDYGDLADIKIKIFDDALQIWSPGFLPFGITVEELHQPTHSSKPKNRLIGQAFYYMGMIERYGSGIGRVISSCAEAGLSDPEFGNYSGGFRVLFKAQVVGPESGPESILQRVLIALARAELSKSEIAAAIGQKPDGNRSQVHGVTSSHFTHNLDFLH